MLDVPIFNALGKCCCEIAMTVPASGSVLILADNQYLLMRDIASNT